MSEKKAKKIDQAIILDTDGDEAQIMRLRQDEEGRTSIEVGRIKETDSMTPEEMEGREVIRAKRREGTPLYDVEVVQEATGHKGPARVSTRAYRNGWDRIFGDIELDDSVPDDAVWN